MAVTFKWEIMEIGANAPDYVPTTLTYRLSGSDGSALQTVHGQFRIAHLTEGVAFEDITEEMALGWLFNDLMTPEVKADQESMIERQLNEQIMRKMRMTQKPPVPWAS